MFKKKNCVAIALKVIQGKVIEQFRCSKGRKVFLFVVCVFLYLLIDLLLLYGHCLIFQAFIYLLYNMN